MKTSIKLISAGSEQKTSRTAWRQKASLSFILSVVLLDLIGMSIIMPVQAYIVRQYSTQAIMVTLLPVLYAGAQFFAAPLLGKLSDRYGRRPVLLISILGSAIGYFLFGIGGALWVLFLSRLIDGITGGNISTASAYIVDITPPQERARNFGLYGAMFGMGFILGPIIGGALSRVSLSAPAYAAGILSLASALVGLLIRPESLAKEKRQASPIRWADMNPFAAVVELLRRPTLRALLITQSIFYLVFNGNNSVVSVFLIEKFGIQAWQIAALFAVGGVTMAFTQGGLVGPLVKRFGEKPMASASLVMQALTSAALVAVPTYPLLFPLMVLVNFGTGLFWPTSGALMANSVAADEQGKVSGVAAALGSLMNVAGPLMAGTVYDHLAPSAPFAIGAVLFLTAGLLLARIKVQKHSQEKVQLAPETE